MDVNFSARSSYIRFGCLGQVAEMMCCILLAPSLRLAHNPSSVLATILLIHVTKTLMIFVAKRVLMTNQRSHASTTRKGAAPTPAQCRSSGWVRIILEVVKLVQGRRTSLLRSNEMLLLQGQILRAFLSAPDPHLPSQCRNVLALATTAVMRDHTGARNFAHVENLDMGRAIVARETFDSAQIR